MGGYMDYNRLLNRNLLNGDYEQTLPLYQRSLIAGDLRRFERDMCDPIILARFGIRCNLTPEQVKCVLEALFDSSWLSGAPKVRRNSNDASG